MHRFLTARLFRKSARAANRNVGKSSTNRFRPTLEALDRRDVPAVWTDATGDGAFGTAGNWSNNAVPASGDYLLFRAANPSLGWVGSTDGVSGMQGTFFGVGIDRSYTGTVTLGGAVTVTYYYQQDGGAIAQPTSGTDLTVTGTFNWTGGTLNSSAHLSGVTLDGATAQIAPASGGTVSLGSNITLTNGAVATMLAGTVNITNDGEEINVGGGCGVSVNPGSGLTTALTSLVSTHIQVSAAGALTINTGVFNAAGRLTNAGTFTLQPNTRAFFPGVMGNNVAYLQTSGATTIYGGSLLGTPGTKNIRVTSGMVNTVFDDGQFGYTADAGLLTGNFEFFGGDLYNNYFSGVPHQVFGRLVISGNFVWTGGTYHVFVEGNVNGGQADKLVVRGDMSVGGTAALDFTAVVGGVVTLATSNYTWDILYMSGGTITYTNANDPSYNTTNWQLQHDIFAGDEIGWHVKSL